jgi:hypothetical protein
MGMQKVQGQKPRRRKEVQKMRQHISESKAQREPRKEIDKKYCRVNKSMLRSQKRIKNKQKVIEW